MKIKGTQVVEVEINKKELAEAIKQVILQDYLDKDFNDKGLKWLTTKDGRTYIHDENNFVTDNREVATLVDTMNILLYYSRLDLENKGV